MPITKTLPGAPVLSQEVKLILDTPPVWLVRWGNVLLLAAIVAILASASFFRYPTTLSGKAVLAPQGPTIVTLSAVAARSVQPGQKVIISLNNFPSDEYGTLTGVVATAPVAAGPQQASVRVYMTAGYTTTYHKILAIRGSSEGAARIITADKRLLDRLLDRVKSI
ncbi:hypothetical protein [Hymenobacter lucidus]|uniref:HlyD family secretion protein n=1 Tax=Hymenobacter lucidus TaxID=2880930 RepID=A0ABS8AVI6_9BACT|nr:hypothetical protein [Hymenobacter lucidus]MCB2409849.1 hypothetical protein [Hymenobacter lucidus]